MGPADPKERGRWRPQALGPSLLRRCSRSGPPSLRFIEEKSSFEYGQVNHALAAAMRTLLKEYLILVTQLEQLQRERGSLDAELKSCQGQEEEYKAKYVNHSIPMGPGGSWEGLNRLSAESCPSSELPESQDRPPLWPLCIPTLSDSQGAPSAAGKRPPSP